MRYFLLVLSLAAVVYSKEVGNTRRFQFPALLTSSFNLQSLLKDSQFQLNDVSGKDWISINYLIDMPNDAIQKCQASSLPDRERKIEDAASKFNYCMSQIQPPGASSGNPSVNETCRQSSEEVKCYVQFTDELKPCLPHYKGGNFPYASIYQTIFNYICGDEEAKQRFESFRENSPPCLEHVRRSGPCGEYREMGVTSYSYSEGDCKLIPDYWTCIGTKFHDVCTPMVMGYMKGIGHAVADNFDFCPSTQKFKKANLFSFISYWE